MNKNDKKRIMDEICFNYSGYERLEKIFEAGYQVGRNEKVYTSQEVKDILFDIAECVDIYSMGQEGGAEKIVVQIQRAINSQMKLL